MGNNSSAAYFRGIVGDKWFSSSARYSVESFNIRNFSNPGKSNQGHDIHYSCSHDILLCQIKDLKYKTDQHQACSH